MNCNEKENNRQEGYTVVHLYSVARVKALPKLEVDQFTLSIKNVDESEEAERLKT